MEWVCDKEADCTDHDDEHRDRGELLNKSSRKASSTTVIIFNLPPTGCDTVACLKDEFQCADGTCVNKVYFCDGDRDCNDGTDEPSDCQHNCATGEFKCNSGKCIMELFKCDGYDHCGDNSDEGKQCESENDHCRGVGWFRCDNGVCINDTLLCNGENNCGDYSDENKCSKLDYSIFGFSNCRL